MSRSYSAFPEYSHRQYENAKEKNEYTVFVESVNFKPKLTSSASVFAADEYEAALIVLGWRPEDWGPDAWRMDRDELVRWGEYLDMTGKPFRAPDNWRVTGIERW